MALLNPREAADLITAKTGRRCSRQNIEQLCKGISKLPISCRSVNPVRLDSETLVDEYLRRVDTRQAGPEFKPDPKYVPRPDGGYDDEIPDYNESRARSEYEKANLLELDRKTKEGGLLKRDVVMAAQAELAVTVRTKILGVPARVKQQAPHIKVGDIQLMTRLLREALEAIADGE